VGEALMISAENVCDAIADPATLSPCEEARINLVIAQALVDIFCLPDDPVPEQPPAPETDIRFRG